MKKLLSIILVLAMILSFNIISHADYNNENIVIATVKDTVTGNIYTYEAAPKINLAHTLSINETSTAYYEVFIPLPNNNSIMPLDTDNSGTTTHGVTASLAVDYTVSSSGDEYKATRFYGSWIPTDSLYYLTYREAGLTAGGLVDLDDIKIYPTSDSFSQNVNWGYLPKQPNGDYQQMAYSVANVCVSGMEHMGTYEIELTCPFADY